MLPITTLGCFLKRFHTEGLSRTLSPSRDSSCNAALSAVFSCEFDTLVPDSWIEQGVQQINNQIDNDIHHRKQDD